MTHQGWSAANLRAKFVRWVPFSFRQDAAQQGPPERHAMSQEEDEQRHVLALGCKRLLHGNGTMDLPNAFFGTVSIVKGTVCSLDLAKACGLHSRATSHHTMNC